MKPPDKPILRQSGLLDFEMCGYRYYLKHVAGNVSRTTFSQLRGLAPHKAREENLRQKITTGTDLPVGDVTDAARDYVIDTYAEKEVLPDPDQEGLSKETVKGQAVDLSVRLARGDYQHYQQPMQPLEVELSLEVDVPAAPFGLGVIIDAVDRSEVLSDCKTAKRTPNANTADESEQLSLYAMVWQAYYGKPVKKMTLDYLVLLKDSVKPVQLTTYPSPQREQAVLRRFMAAWSAMQANIYVPCCSSHWVCGPKYCEFYNTVCPYAIAGKQRPTS